MKTLEEVLKIKEYQINSLLFSDEKELIRLGFKRKSENEFYSSLDHETFNYISIERNKSNNGNDIIFENNQTSDKEKVFNIITDLYNFFNKELDFELEDLDKQTIGGKSGKSGNTFINKDLENNDYFIAFHIFIFEFGLRISISNNKK